jgi:hypothetical protein
MPTWIRVVRRRAFRHRRARFARSLVLSGRTCFRDYVFSGAAPPAIVSSSAARECKHVRSAFAAISVSKEPVVFVSCRDNGVPREGGA